MKLWSVEAIDVQGVPNGVYSFAKDADHAHDHVLITGGPGVGKTRFLELITAVRNALVPHFETGPLLGFIRPRNKSSKAVVSWLLTTEEQAIIGAAGPVVSTETIFGAENLREGVDPRLLFLLERYGHDDRTPKLEYFSEQRRLEFGGGEMALNEKAQAPFRASGDPRKFAFVPSLLADLPTTPESETRFATILEQLSPSVAYDTQQHALSSRGRAVRNLRELSASEADAVLFAATAVLVGLSRSIVLVDRPEVNGIGLARALAGLAALGADNQLILATASPELLDGFDGAVVELDSRQLDRGRR
jgi:hypothetical protein